MDDDGSGDVPLSARWVREDEFDAGEAEAAELDAMRAQLDALRRLSGRADADGAVGGGPATLPPAAVGSGADDGFSVEGDADDAEGATGDVGARLRAWQGGDIDWPTVPQPAASAAAGGDLSPPPPRFEALTLRIVFTAGRTGFEEVRDFHPVPGEVVAGRYLVRGVVGTAAFSTAVAASDLVCGGAPVCLKVVRNRKDFVDQSLDELKLLRYLNAAPGGDPDASHTLRLHDYFYFREHLVLVTELLQLNLYELGRATWPGSAGERGGPAAAPLSPPFFTLPRVRAVAAQVLTALSVMHGCGLLHCDVKPENIVVADYAACVVKLIDYGSSCFATDALSTYIQSRSYRAPEVVLGALPYGPRIDVWSLGCVLAELATGRVLFANDSVQAMLARMAALCGPFPPELLRRSRNAPAYFTAATRARAAPSPPPPPRGGASAGGSTVTEVYERLPAPASPGAGGDDGVGGGAGNGGDGPVGGWEREEELLVALTGLPVPQDGGRWVAVLTPQRTCLRRRLGPLLASQAGATDAAEVDGFLDFLAALLVLDPAGRPSAAQALAHPWLAGVMHQPVPPYQFVGGRGSEG